MVGFCKSRRRLSLIGVDIGISGTRAVQLEQAGRPGTGMSAEYVVMAWAATGSDVSGLGGDSTTHDVQQQLRHCLDVSEFQGRGAGVSLSAPAVEVYPLELPAAIVSGESTSGHANSVNVDQVVQWEIERLRKEPTDASGAAGTDIETRFWGLPTTRVSAPNVIGVAAPRRRVLQVLDICSAAGLNCTRIDAGATAAARLGAILRPWSDDEVWAVLDLGGEAARVVVCLDDVPVLVRNVGSGGRMWTRLIADTLKLSLKSAEVHKCEHGLSPANRGVRRADQLTEPGLNRVPRSEVASIVFGVLRSELKDLASQVKRSYEYVLSCYPTRRVSDLVLIGGGATMKNLPEYLGDALGITVRRVSDYLQEPSCRLTWTSRNHASLETLAMAVGTAVEPSG